MRVKRLTAILLAAVFLFGIGSFHRMSRANLQQLLKNPGKLTRQLTEVNLLIRRKQIIRMTHLTPRNPTTLLKNPWKMKRMMTLRNPVKMKKEPGRNHPMKAIQSKHPMMNPKTNKQILVQAFTIPS